MTQLASPPEVAATVTDGGRRRGTRPGAGPAGRVGRRGLRVTPWLFLVVPLAFLIVLTYVPVANLLWYSVTDWDGLSPVKEFVGLENFVEIFTRPEIFQVFFVSLFYLAGAVAQLVLALYFATLLSFKTRFSNLFKGIIFFPYLINGVAIGLVFLYFFRPGGTLDALAALVGVEDTPQWLGDPGVVNTSLAATSVWRYMGLNFVLFLGAIQSVPSEQYEAADLDMVPQLTRLREAGADTLFLVGNVGPSAQVVKSLDRMGWSVPVVSHWGPAGGRFDELAGPSAAKVHFIQTFTFAGNTSPKALAVLDALKAKYPAIKSMADVTPAVGIANAYDATHLLALAIKAAGSTKGPEVRDGFYKVATYPGLIKTYDKPFAPGQHDALGPQDYVFTRFRNGEIVAVTN